MGDSWCVPTDFLNILKKVTEQVFIFEINNLPSLGSGTSVPQSGEAKASLPKKDIPL